MILAAGALALASSAAFAEETSLKIESWRNDDLAVWRDVFIPAFEAKNPNIKVKFAPTAPTAYDAALNAKLEAGTAGDLITCRPFDLSLKLFGAGRFVDLTNMPGMENFGPAARTAWSSDDGATTFCVPINSTISGFIYNKNIFDELGLTEPNTEDEFFALLEKIKTDGNYVPLATGTADQWESTTMGYDNIGPNYWHGEEGRKALIAGTQKLTDEPWVAPLRTLKRWADYMGDGFEARSYPDSQNIFTLGRAAIFPAGSWEISVFEAQADFPMDAFRPPLQQAGDKCFILDHPGMGMAVNTASPNKEAAMKFVEWMATPEFAQLLVSALPGFFSLSNHDVKIENPLAAKFLSWRKDCDSTIRHAYQILSRGTPTLENATWRATSSVINGTETPEDAAKRLQDGLASWYAPQQGK
jgi:raffinose/stachyose/melibiose transport system substrate-binding protein